MGRRYQSSTIAGSPLYMAPEQLAGSYLTTKVGPRRARGRGAPVGSAGAPERLTPLRGLRRLDRSLGRSALAG